MVSNDLAIVWATFKKKCAFFNSFGHTAIAKTGVQQRLRRLLQEPRDSHVGLPQQPLRLDQRWTDI